MAYTGDEARGRTVLDGRGFLPLWLERSVLYPFIETLVGNVETSLDDKIEAVRTDTNLALDTDGTPYFNMGSNELWVLSDTDGNPYFETVK